MMTKFNDILSLALLMYTIPITRAFLLHSRPNPSVLRQTSSRQYAAVGDPTTLIQQALDLHNHVVDTSSVVNHMDSLLSTMYTTGVAHGHSNSWFGPADAYLEAGKSIVPADAKMALSSDLPKIVQELTSQGVTVLDGSKMTQESYFPGFTPTTGILPARELSMTPQTMSDFSTQASWVKGFMNVMDKLPAAAFAYCLVEFFVLRPNVDLYKSEIEQESPTTLWADALSTLTVRMVAMGLVTMVTLALFG